jgi:uncharacterized protein
MPIFYECDRCTACCRWPGQVRVSSDEISAIAAFLNVTEHDFIQQFTRLSHDRRGLALQDKDNGECIFLEAKDCRINPVKPDQCRGFPNLWNFPGFEQVCRAKARVVNEDEYQARIEQATGHVPPNKSA